MMMESVDEKPRQRARVAAESTGEQVGQEIELNAASSNSNNSSTSGIAIDTQQPMFVQKRTLPFEIRTGDFLYNTRILFLVLFSVAPILAMAGKFSLTLLVTGFIAVYVLDFLNLKKWQLIVFWGTLSVFWMSIYFSSFSFLWLSFFNIFTLMHGSLFVLLVGIWGSLQSDWFKSWSPELAVVCERMLFTVLPVVCVPLLVSVSVAISGIRNSPFYLAISMCAIIHWFVRAERSSFKAPNNSVRSVTTEADLFIQRRTDCAFLVILSMFLPVVMYFAVYHRTIDIFSFQHYVTIASLAGFPIIMLALNPNQYLWWSPEILRDASLEKVRMIIVGAIAANAVLWFEYRVIFERYPHIMALPAPWNYILVTFALYAMIIIGMLILKDKLGASGRVAAIFLSSLVVAFIALLVGFPILLIPLPAVAMFEAASFYFSKSWTHYAVFAVSTVLSILVWLARSFWFLDYEFEFTLLPISWTINLSHALVAIALLAALSIAIVPALLMPQLKHFNLLILVSHGAVLGWLEQLLFEQGEGFYSPFLVFFTSALGMYLSTCLLASQRLSPDAASILMAVYLGKLGILLAPIRMALLATFLTCVTISRIYVASQLNEKISTGMCWIYVAASGINLFLTRHVLVSNLLEFVMDTRYYQVTESRILGACVFLWGVHLIPLSYQFFPKHKLLKRITLVFLIMGAVWAFWQPSFSVSGEESMDLSTSSNVAAAHMSEYTSAWWVSWVIVIAILSALVTFAAPKKFTQTIAFRIALTSILGIGLGLAFCGTYLRFAPLSMYFLICSSFTIVGFVLYSTHYPLFDRQQGAAVSADNQQLITSSPYMISIVAYAVLFFLAFPSIAMCFFIHEDAEVIRSSVISVMGIFITLNVFLAILLKFKVSGRPLYRFKASKKVQEQLSQNASTTPEDSLEIACIINVAAITAYLMGASLIAWISWQNYLAYLIISSSLLLLATDKYLLRHFEDNHRYTLTFGVVQILVVVFFFIDYYTIARMVIARFSLSLLFKASLTLSTFFCAVPAHVFAFILLYTLKKPNVQMAVLCGLMSLVAVVIAPFDSVFYNGVYGVAVSLLQLFTSARFQDALPAAVQQFL